MITSAPRTAAALPGIQAGGSSLAAGPRSAVLHGRACRHCGSSVPIRTAGDQLLADYLDFMRKHAGDGREPHVRAHAEYCRRRNVPDTAAERLWQRWLRHYLNFGRS